MYGPANYGWGAGMWILMGVGMLVFWAIVVGETVALVRYFGHTHEAAVSSGSLSKVDPEGIVRERLARGEIDEEEFRIALDVLDAGGQTHRQVLRRWARPGWDADDPDYTAEREVRVLELLDDAGSRPGRGGSRSGGRVL